jgi:hypothetical protein
LAGERMRCSTVKLQAHSPAEAGSNLKFKNQNAKLN